MNKILQTSLMFFIYSCSGDNSNTQNIETTKVLKESKIEKPNNLDSIVPHREEKEFRKATLDLLGNSFVIIKGETKNGEFIEDKVAYILKDTSILNSFRSSLFKGFNSDYSCCGNSSYYI